MIGKPRASSLRSAFLADLSAAWQQFQKTFPDQSPYALVLFSMPNSTHFVAVVLTETVLEKVAQKYVDLGLKEELAHAARELRFSVPDALAVGAFSSVLAAVRQRLDDKHGSELSDQAYASAIKSGTAALKDLDLLKCFGTGKRRDKLLLMVEVDGINEEWVERHIKQLNSASAFRRFKESNRREGHYASFYSGATSTDGNLLCAVGGRENPDARPGSEQEFTHEIAALRVTDGRVRRRWTFDYPVHESGRVVCYSTTDNSFVVLSARYGNGATLSVLRRFRGDSNRPLDRAEIIGEPVGLAISRDGRQIAISMATGELAVVDEQLKLIHRHALGFQADTPVILSTGEFLVGDNSRIMRLDPKTGKRLRTWKLPGTVMSVDKNERFLVSSRRVSLTGEDRHEAFGMTVLHLPSMSVHHEYELPRMQLLSPTLSPNGELLAVHAEEVDSYRTKVVVFDNATGQIVAERKFKANLEMTFLPDCNTLAIFKSGIVSKEPIELWAVTNVP